MRQHARQRIEKAEKEDLCVGCLQPLGGQKPIRGLHSKCYQATLRAIKAGKFTEKQRVESGKMLEGDTPGRKPSNPVSIEAEAS